MTNDSLLIASVVLDQLVQTGVREIFFAPGSRSAPFVYSVAGRDGRDLRAHVRLDERSAAFHALGAARATGVPSAVVTTSGTAVGNVFPAVLEADHAQVPLIVVTADRPLELRGTGANQTTRQPGIFGDHVRASVDVTLPPGITPEQCVSEVAQTVESTLGVVCGGPETQPGPVHLNVALREPLHPALSETPGEGHDGAAPSAVWDTRGLHLACAVQMTREQQESVRDAASCLPRRRTVILAGDGAGYAAGQLAEALHLPLLAEPSSGARHGANAVDAYRLLVETDIGAAIDHVVLMGRPTLSRPITALLRREDVRTAAWQPEPVAWYEPGRRRETVLTTLHDVLEFAGRGDSTWTHEWKNRGRQAIDAVMTELADVARRNPGYLPGPVVAREIWQACGLDGALLVAGASNPIRDLDLVAAAGHDAQSGPMPHPAGVIANRGLAGIDGTVATASGAALATGMPTRALVGDLTFLHDAGSLLKLAMEQQPDLTIVVVDDRGGGIFTTLEHGALRQRKLWANTVERFFGTEPDVDIPALCRAYGVPVVSVGTVDELQEHMRRPVQGVSVVVVHAQRESLRDVNRRIEHAVARRGSAAPAWP